MPRHVLKNQHLRSLRDDLKLRDFINEDQERKHTWFQGIDTAIDGLRTILRGAEPSDEIIVDAVVASLQEDQRFNEHIRKRTDAAWRAVEQNWLDALRATAGTVLQMYLDAVEKGLWPEEES